MQHPLICWQALGNSVCVPLTITSGVGDLGFEHRKRMGVSFPARCVVRGWTSVATMPTSVRTRARISDWPIDGSSWRVVGNASLRYFKAAIDWISTVRLCLFWWWLEWMTRVGTVFAGLKPRYSESQWWRWFRLTQLSDTKAPSGSTLYEGEQSN